ncbi:holin family protein [Amaricoccus macauensis]|uniref:holin family protein n=1 Tax=Amaricoccus macauensis TaxID=57001 RepID=UPI003C7AAA4A
MGLIGRVVGLGRTAEQIGGAVGGVAEVFVGNAAEQDQADLERIKGTLDQYKAEYSRPPLGPFDRFVEGLNRLPRPMLAIGTLLLFVYAMADPQGFSERMTGLNLIPDQLWWLLGAIVSFYFGARELHHFRTQQKARPSKTQAITKTLSVTRSSDGAEPTPLLGSVFQNASFGSTGSEPAVEVRASDPEFNAAVEEWRVRSGARQP